MDPLDFTGRAVVVTGGTRGIGAAIAAAFLEAGARVLVCGRNPPAPAAADADAPARLADVGRADAGRAAEFFRADVRDPAQAAALVEAAVVRLGRIDVLVNNAGGAPPAPAATASPRLHAKIIELNLVAPLHVSQAANAVMQRQAGGGVILMIGSVSGTRPSPGTAAYGAAKAGLHHLATTLAAEWAPAVRVNSVIPGPVADVGPDPRTAAGVGPDPRIAAGVGPDPRTGAGAGPDPGAAEGGGPGREVAAGLDPEAVARTVPMGRAATAAEVAGVCLLLASPLASYVSGAALAVHGGGEWPGYLADLRGSAYPAQK
ncbi:NAD(P)-dependent dehydrogenase (short-subunit alcohol dehydrogenase family) [Actinoplanes tereljensis]|uniref:Short chain dehydrogenase n=1 Tax=Paractinoplanes tereljensis TaxID=571912 RepID=A0A919TWD2_9ACTN|nr:SDR family oxidoreductase [Actinoplanes tereljensis]GIF22777.1 short chain dehydrogenase [Actinoplanes tereljensis]